jgi:phosphoribosyl 1,2-cyclic phosphodiesterase
MRLCVIGSGSSGNVLYAESGDARILVDVGLSGRETSRRLTAVGIDPSSLTAIILTHEHADHAKGVSVLARTYGLPIYVSPATRDACQFGRNAEQMRFVDISSSEPFRIGGLEFYPFTVPHDAADQFGFILESERAKAAIVTDLGYITQLVCDRVRGADVLILESNHDVEMLKICPHYPWALKQRVLSRHGHLSNDHVSEFLQRDFDGKAEHIILAHLSKNTNHPHLARLSALQALDARGSLFFRDAERRVRCAEQDKPGEWIEL